MAETDEALQNPFSMENAYLKFRRNTAEAARLKAETDAARGREDVSVRETLLQAVDALSYLTDNAALPKIMRQALEARDAK